MYVIEDIRDKRIFIDDSGLIRSFEKILEANISLKKAKEKYPKAIDCRRKVNA